jgi:hypothetical protein
MNTGFRPAPTPASGFGQWSIITQYQCFGRCGRILEIMVSKTIQSNDDTNPTTPNAITKYEMMKIQDGVLKVSGGAKSIHAVYPKTKQPSEINNNNQ